MSTSHISTLTGMNPYKLGFLEVMENEVGKTTPMNRL
jgi:hypothetical protein